MRTTHTEYSAIPAGGGRYHIERRIISSFSDEDCPIVTDTQRATLCYDFTPVDFHSVNIAEVVASMFTGSIKESDVLLAGEYFSGEYYTRIQGD